MAKRGDRGGPCSGRWETLTSVRSTTSHGASPNRRNHSRNPAYSIADRRDSHATFRLSGKSASSHNRSDPEPMSFQSVRPSSFSTHYERNDESDGLINPKHRSSKEENTRSHTP